MSITQEKFNAGIIDIGVYIPEKKMSEQDFINAGVPKEYIDMWGVYEHRVSEPDEAPSDMSVKAAKNLIKSSGIDPKEIDLIIDCAFVPDYINPGNSLKIQHELGAENATTLDIVPSSGGVIPQLITAKALIMSQAYEKVLITCSSKFTYVADKSDWLSLTVAGDGAAAAFVSKVEEKHGILSSNMITRGELNDISGIRLLEPVESSKKGRLYENDNKKMLFIPAYGSERILKGRDEEKKKLNEFILSSIPRTSKIALDKLGLNYDDVDFWITHQNIRSLSDHWLNELKVKDKGNYYYSYNKYGNLYNANLLVNLKEAIDNGYIHDNDIVVLGGLTSGFSTGAVVMKWGK